MTKEDYAITNRLGRIAHLAGIGQHASVQREIAFCWHALRSDIGAARYAQDRIVAVWLHDVEDRIKAVY